MARRPTRRSGPAGRWFQHRLVSWSTAKSITHAAVGLLVHDGVIDPQAPAAVPAWAGTDKERITLLDLLEMRPGLQFVEDYVDGAPRTASTCCSGRGVTTRGVRRRLAARPSSGTVWNYSSGTTNIICRIVGDAVGGGEPGMRAFLRDRLFGPLGMESAEPRFDGAGTWVGSSYVDTTALDYARFGELYRNDGIVGGERICPSWVDHGRTFVAHDPTDGVPGGFDYGRHWWMWPEFPGSIAAHGYEGQYIVVVPDRELVVVHLGKTDATVRAALVAQLHDLVRRLTCVAAGDRCQLASRP